jgi:hypothetical protein
LCKPLRNFTFYIQKITAILTNKINLIDFFTKKSVFILKIFTTAKAILLSTIEQIKESAKTIAKLFFFVLYLDPAYIKAFLINTQ